MDKSVKSEVALVLSVNNEVEAETRWIFITKPEDGKEIYLEILDYLEKAGRATKLNKEKYLQAIHSNDNPIDNLNDN